LSRAVASGAWWGDDLPGNPAAARAYVEADRSRADDYYLAEGTGLATRLVATPDGVFAQAPLGSAD
jgi:hypothetical protein